MALAQKRRSACTILGGRTPAIHRSAWKVRSANFVMTEFSEVYLPGGAAMAVRAYRGSRARDWGAPRAAWPRRRASVVEDRHVEPAQARRVGEDVDLHDLSASDREAHNRKRPSTRGHDDARGPIHERRSYERGEP
jgi:hypothetical protein